MSQHDPMVCIHHMLDHASEAAEMVENRSRKELDTNRMLNLALVRLVEIIGEAANRIPDEFQTMHSDLPWREIIGMRNRLVHGYDTVDLDILWQILQTDIPPLIDQLEQIVSTNQ